MSRLEPGDGPDYLLVQVLVPEEPVLPDHLPRTEALHGGPRLQPQVSRLRQDHHLQGESGVTEI